jgi:transposase
LKNNAKYINLEDLSDFSGDDIILRNWSYYQMQQYIVYKAELNGIIVRKINPYHTSQICSKCGHWEEGQRDSQSHFKCKACGNELNADVNAARNIAKSKEFVIDDKDKKKGAKLDGKN